MLEEDWFLDDMHLQVKIWVLLNQKKQLKWIQRNLIHDEILFYFVFTLWKGIQEKKKNTLVGKKNK